MVKVDQGSPGAENAPLGLNYFVELLVLQIVFEWLHRLLFFLFLLGGIVVGLFISRSHFLYLDNLK